MAQDHSPAQDKLEEIKGVFSTEVQSWIGSGATRRKTSQTVYYYVEEKADGHVLLQPLNANWLPVSQDSRRMERAEFVKKYRPEPEAYLEKTLPALKELSKTIAKAERMRSKGEPYSAEWEYKKALTMDAANIRATFGLGLTYLDRGEKEKADDLLRQLVKLEEAFDPENKHLFNEFGIKLRRNKMYEQALSYYAKAFKLSGNDENLLYNIARTLVEQGDLPKAAVFLKKALKINKAFPEALKLLGLIQKKLARDKAKAG
jgi:tetratricopeptide (TPR) repeat protein